jgi:inosose dehydratase
LHSDRLLDRIASTQIAGYEPIVNSASELNGLQDRLHQHGLQMRSLYVNSVLHDAARIDASIENVVRIAKAARGTGTRIVVTNPAPIRWGGDEDKSDAELRLQARSLDQLGAQLRQLGVTLAYHNHDAELRQGGREFHHMLTATNEENVKLCLDAHWVYRGCGNSEVAVFDVLTHYHDRIVELHLRQSVNGTWTETFTVDGDIDYARLFAFLSARSIFPHLVLEQAVESSTPNKLDVVKAHRQSNSNTLIAVDGVFQ